MKWLWQVFGAAHNSTKGLINEEELFKSIWASLGVSGFSGLLIAILTGIGSHSPDIFQNATTASAVTFGLALVVDLLKRRGDGQVPVSLPPGSTVPETGAIAPPPDVPTAPMAHGLGEWSAPVEKPPRGLFRSGPDLDQRGEFIKQPRPGEADSH